MILGATHYGILQEELGNKIGQWILQTSTSKLFLASHHAHLGFFPLLFHSNSFFLSFFFDFQHFQHFFLSRYISIY